MSHVNSLAAAMDRVPVNVTFVVRAVLRNSSSEHEDDDGALWLEVVTASRRDCVRVRHSDGDGVCLGLVGFERNALSLRTRVATKLRELGYDVAERAFTPAEVHAYYGVALVEGKKKPTAQSWDF